LKNEIKTIKPYIIREGESDRDGGSVGIRTFTMAINKNRSDQKR